jgi:uncharacterized protein
MLIDCDLHPFIEDLGFVYRRMPAGARRQLEGSGVFSQGRAGDRLPFPGGSGWRDDAATPGGGMAATDPAYVLKHHLEPGEIDAALLISVQATTVNAWTDRALASAFTRAFNEALLERWCAADSRYRLAAAVSPLDPDRSAREIRRYAKVDGVAAINIPAINILLGNLHFNPILKAAAECDLALVVHPTGAEGAQQSAPSFAGIPNSYPEWKAVFSQVAHSNLASLIFEGAFERFPGLKVVFVEFGFSWLGPALWRMDQNWRDLRSSVPWVRRAPSEYVAESVRFTTQPLDDVGKREHFRAILEMAHAERTLMFSSDYPHYDNDNPFTSMAAIPTDLRERVRAGNALEIFGERIRPRAAALVAS